MKKSKNSLKKVYESVFKLTKEDRQADIDAEFQRRILARNPANAKTLKALYAAGNDDASPANDDDIINQTISTEIPGLGTFDLTPVQIGLIGCIDQYYYGDKQLALNLINILKTGQSIEPEQTSQRVHLAAGHIRENENSSKPNNNLIKKKKGWRLKMDATHAKEFIDDCVKYNILKNENNMYSINEGFTISQNKYNISTASGYLFEMFLCFNIEKWFGEDNVNSTINVERLANNSQVCFILQILLVIYNIFLINQINTIIKSNTSLTIQKSRELYEKLNLANQNIFEKFLDDTFKSNKSKLYFDFQEEHAPLDFYVRKNNAEGNVITMFDLKTSTIGNVNTTLSTSFVQSNDQIYEIFNEEHVVDKDESKINYNNFYISSLNILYTYNNKGIKIDDTVCCFIDFKVEYQRIKDNISNESGEGENRSFRIDVESGNYLTLDNGHFPISEMSDNDVSVDNLDYSKIATIRKIVKVFKNKEIGNSSIGGPRTFSGMFYEIKKKIKKYDKEIQDNDHIVYDILESAISNYIDKDVKPKLKVRKDIIIKRFIDYYDGRRTSDAERQAGSKKVVLNVCKNSGLSDKLTKCVRNIVEALIKQEETKSIEYTNKALENTNSNFLYKILKRHYESISNLKDPKIYKIMELAISNYIDRDVMPNREENKQKIIDWAIKRFGLKYSSDDEKAEGSKNVVLKPGSPNVVLSKGPDGMDINEISEIDHYANEVFQAFLDKEKLDTLLNYDEIVYGLVRKINRKIKKQKKIKAIKASDPKIYKIMEIAISNYIKRDVMPSREKNKTQPRFKARQG